MKQFVDPRRKEVKPCNMIDVVCPINKEAAPDHEEQHRKVHPVKPADRE
jgi:hypothetical protein